jgi:hypothetical protein
MSDFRNIEAEATESCLAETGEGLSFLLPRSVQGMQRGFSVEIRLGWPFGGER